MQKNVAGQKWVVFAFDPTTNLPVTGDAANITANLRKDGGASTPTNDVNPTELEGGEYEFDLIQAETNADFLVLHPSSTTINVEVIAIYGVFYTTPANFPALGIESDGDLTKVNLCDSNTDMRGTDGASTFNPATDEVDIGAVKGVGVADVDDFKADVSALALEATSQDILDQVTGTGNRVVTINVKDDGANNLQDVLVRIGTASVYTDVAGNAVFALDDGDYDVILRKQYVSFTVPESLTVSGDGTHPYVGTLITPSLPVQPDTCVVYGVVIDDGGFPVEGASIFINETDNNTFANTQKIVKNRQTTSDSDGFWELEIVRSSQLDPADSPYDAIITYPNGFKYETTITVPDQDTVEFSTIAGT